ncbi:MAG: (d)CMP kinase [Clostridia bacterium]|nr:(d)CMP kinase [Clostridia bacterium]
MPLTIAIDGPVGAGKSTISDAVAKSLNILHLDTGAMYRAVGLGVLDLNTDPEDEEKVVSLLTDGKIIVDVKYEDGQQVTLLNGVSVNDRIRTQEAGGAASTVSRYPGVRRAMVRLQQALAEKCPMLLDGRDIGTVVLPNATAKIYLTASVKIRAGRRMEQLREKGDMTPFEDILREVEARDWQDTHRETDPLRQAEDAVLVDSGSLSFEETVESILKIVREKYHG